MVRGLAVSRWRSLAEALPRWLLWLSVSLTAWLVPGVLGAVPGDEAASEPTVELFVREGCPHCAAAEAFLSDLRAERPGLRLIVHRLDRDQAALERLQTIAKARGARVAVPAILVGEALHLGFSVEAGSDRALREALSGHAATAHAGQSSGVNSAACPAETGLVCPAGQPEQAFEVSLLGFRVSLEEVGLPVFTLAIGLLDGFNPCSMWVLILMISLLAPLNDRRRMLAIAGTFVLVEAVVYYLLMAAWLHLYLLIGLSRSSELIIAAVAMAAGLLNVKDGLAPGSAPLLAIPEKVRPGIYARLRGILQARGIGAAIVGTLILGLLVQIVELLCTSGFPALYTRILTLRQVDAWSYHAYLLLYDLAYMFDDAIVLAVGVVTLSRRRLQEREGRWLRLGSGVVMLGLGIYLLVGS